MLWIVPIVRLTVGKMKMTQKATSEWATKRAEWPWIYWCGRWSITSVLHFVKFSYLIQLQSDLRNALMIFYCYLYIEFGSPLFFHIFNFWISLGDPLFQACLVADQLNILQSIVPPNRRNREHTLDNFRGRCPTMVRPFFHNNSISIGAIVLDISTSPKSASHIF